MPPTQGWLSWCICTLPVWVAQRPGTLVLSQVGLCIFITSLVQPYSVSWYAMESWKYSGVLCALLTGSWPWLHSSDISCQDQEDLLSSGNLLWFGGGCWFPGGPRLQQLLGFWFWLAVASLPHYLWVKGGPVCSLALLWYSLNPSMWAGQAASQSLLRGKVFFSFSLEVPPILGCFSHISSLRLSQGI